MSAHSLQPFLRRGAVEEVRRHDETNACLSVTFDGDDEMTPVRVHSVASVALDQTSIDTALVLNNGELVEVKGVIIQGDHHARRVRRR